MSELLCTLTAPTPGHPLGPKMAFYRFDESRVEIKCKMYLFALIGREEMEPHIASLVASGWTRA